MIHIRNHIYQSAVCHCWPLYGEILQPLFGALGKKSTTKTNPFGDVVVKFAATLRESFWQKKTPQQKDPFWSCVCLRWFFTFYHGIHHHEKTPPFGTRLCLWFFSNHRSVSSQIQRFCCRCCNLHGATVFRFYHTTLPSASSHGSVVPPSARGFFKLGWGFGWGKPVCLPNGCFQK